MKNPIVFDFADGRGVDRRRSPSYTSCGAIGVSIRLGYRQANYATRKTRRPYVNGPTWSCDRGLGGSHLPRAYRRPKVQRKFKGQCVAKIRNYFSEGDFSVECFGV